MVWDSTVETYTSQVMQILSGTVVTLVKNRLDLNLVEKEGVIPKRNRYLVFVHSC